MKRSALVCLTMLAVVTPAAAYENFIPLGAGYSTEIYSIPNPETKRGKLSSQTDIIETDIYMKELQARQRDSRFRRFMSGTESHGFDNFVDY